MKDFFKDLLVSNTIIICLIWVGYTFFNLNGYTLIPNFLILAFLQIIIIICSKGISILKDLVQKKF